MRIKYTINSTTGHFSFYYLRTTEPLLLTRDDTGIVSISSTKCFIEGCYGENNGTEVPRSKYNFSDEQKSQPENSFISIWQANDRIHSKIIRFPQIGYFPQDPNYLDSIDFLDQSGNYTPISDIIVW